MSDDLDTRLRDYANRWRQNVPTARLDPAALTSPRRRQWPALVAASVVTVLVGVGAVLIRAEIIDDGPTPPASSPTGLVDGMVPFLPLPPTYPNIPTETIPASPDPALAADLPACRAADLTVTDRMGAAMGTTIIRVLIRGKAGVECRLEGYPGVTFLDHGTPLDLPTEHSRDDSDYRQPVRVTPDDVAVLSLWWASEWCGVQVDNDRIRATLPEQGGTLEFAGFGQTRCSPSAGDPAPITIWSFAPEYVREAEERSAFHDVEVTERDLSQPVEGEPFFFAVTLTATRADISLDVCPDFTIGQQSGPTSWEQQRYALNCDGVPGHVLPQGVPVTFRMETVLDLAQGKHVWSLDVPDALGVGFGYQATPPS